jgi:hypothetical protein
MVHTHGCPAGVVREHHDAANDYAIGDDIVVVFETATGSLELKITHGFGPFPDSCFDSARASSSFTRGFPLLGLLFESGLQKAQGTTPP